MSQFVHLHLHSGFSLLDGAIDHDVLAKTAAKYGMPAVAVTDHGNLFGAIGFYEAATKGRGQSRSSAARCTSRKPITRIAIPRAADRII